jgi:fatty acid desaturase
MTPKFYGYLWLAFAAIAALSLIAAGFSLLAWVVVGFVAFGMIWAGMICVLPGMSGHSHEAPVAERKERRESVREAVSTVHAGGFAKYRSV